MHRNTRMRALIIGAAVGLLSAGTTSCMATVRPRAGVLYATSAPPRAIREARPLAPGRDFVWVPGHYAYQGRSYVWVGGKYERPPFDNMRRWEPGKWNHDRNGWYWVDGGWH